MGKEKIILTCILVLGLGLRLVNLGQSFWLDEASQAQLSSLTLSQIWTDRPSDFHPPLFYVLAHFWLLFGHSEIWLRLLPVSFGVANIYVLYLLAKKINSHLGLLAPFLLAITPFHIYYSQEFRSYSLLCLLGTLSMYLLFTRRYFWTSLVNALLLYTHYSSIFLIMAQFIINPSIIPYSIFTVLFYLPWSPQFVRQLSAGVSIDTYLPGWREVLSISPLKAFPEIIFKLVAGRINFLSRWLYLAYIIFIFVVTFLAIIFGRDRQKRFLMLWALAPVFIMLLTSFVVPQNQPFRVIYVVPAFAILFSLAVLRFPKIFMTFLVYIAVVGNLAYFTRPRLQREQWRQAIQFLSSQSGQIVVSASDKFSPFYWYAPGLPVTAAVPTYPAKPQEVSRLAPNQSTVFYLEYLSGLTDPKLLVPQTLVNLGFTLDRIYDFSGVGFIYKYSKL